MSVLAEVADSVVILSLSERERHIVCFGLRALEKVYLKELASDRPVEMLEDWMNSAVEIQRLRGKLATEFKIPYAFYRATPDVGMSFKPGETVD